MKDIKILIIDNLTETFDGEIVKSGLQKSSKLDAQAFSLFYDTSYLYCGNIIENKYNYKHIKINDIGAKDKALKLKNNSKLSRIYIKEYILNNIKIIDEFDYIIAHCHSISMLNLLNDNLKNKNILFIIHDVIDLFWCAGFSNAVKKLRNNKNNNVKIYTNSNYSIQRYLKQYQRGLKYEYNMIKDVFDGYIKHFVWTDLKIDDNEIINKHNYSVVIGRYEKSKYHHKLYKYNNINNPIYHLGIKDIRRDKNLKYYNKLISIRKYKENLNDKELYEFVKKSKSIILPCFHEGFGFTAFEAGIYGCVPVILKKEETHATSEYLTRANVKHFIADFNNTNDINIKIDKSLNINNNERIEISNNLLNYFTVENYVRERMEVLKNV